MRLPEIVRFKAEDGLLRALGEAARRERTTVAEYLRRRVRSALEADGVKLPTIKVASTRSPRSNGRAGAAGGKTR
jgi:hypothetical protein